MRFMGSNKDQIRFWPHEMMFRNNFKACDCTLYLLCKPSVEMLHIKFNFVNVYICSCRKIPYNIWLKKKSGYRHKAKSSKTENSIFKLPTLCVWDTEFTHASDLFKGTRIKMRISECHSKTSKFYLLSYMPVITPTKAQHIFFDLWGICVAVLMNMVPSSLRLITVINLAQENNTTFECQQNCAKPWSHLGLQLMTFHYWLICRHIF